MLGWWLRSIVIDAAVHGPPSTHTSSSSNRGTLLAHISLALSVPTWITALLCWSAFILEDWPRYGPSLSPAASISRIVSITACSVLDQFSPLCWQLMVSQFNPPFFVCQMMFLASYSLQIVMFFTVWPNCVHFFLYIFKKNFIRDTSFFWYSIRFYVYCLQTYQRFSLLCYCKHGCNKIILLAYLLTELTRLHLCASKYLNQAATVYIDFVTLRYNHVCICMHGHNIWHCLFLLQFQ